MPLEIENASLKIGDIDSDGDIEIWAKYMPCYITKEEAELIIKHLQEQFSLNP